MAALPAFFAHLSYLGLFAVVFATGAGLPLPEDVVVLGAGYLVHTRTLALVPTILVALVGVIAGDVFLYALGHRVGGSILAHPRVARRFPPETLSRAKTFFDRWGIAAIVVARVVLGVRAAVYFTAGSLRMPFARFLVVDTIASIVHVPLLVMLGVWAGDRLDAVSERIASVKLVVLAIVVVSLIVGIVVQRVRATRPAR